MRKTAQTMTRRIVDTYPASTALRWPNDRAGHEHPVHDRPVQGRAGRDRAGRNELAEVAHDARNMATALDLYCDLLAEPGVLAPGSLHLSAELRLLSSAGHRLVEKLTSLDRCRLAADASEDNETDDAARGFLHVLDPWPGQTARRGTPPEEIQNLAGQVLAHRKLLAALAGPGVKLSMQVVGGREPVRMTGGDLTRILVNLVKNSVEAMPSGGGIRIALRKASASRGMSLLLTVEDDGPGIPAGLLNKVFDRGFTTRPLHRRNGYPDVGRGLGLSITRTIVQAAGGRISAGNQRTAGARFQIELPVGVGSGGRR
ncbi:MAG TPA: sensor histidine kinase [Terracidiphilus sp.]|nr:sensor histidine kinase [Terracidiphilus sp.]